MKEIIATEVGSIFQNQSIHRMLDGSWSLYELIDYIIDTTGPVNAFISSFSISEAAVCSFQQMLEDGRFKSLSCLLDSSLRKTKTSLLFFLHNTGAGLRLTLNHSKIILLHNETWYISINASANMSRNRRIEAMVLCSDPQVFYYYQTELIKHYDSSVPFLP
jgi:hypothetical protein